MWLTLSKAEAKQKDVINPYLDAQTSPGKLAPTLLISPKTICPAGANTQARAWHAPKCAAIRRCPAHNPQS